MSGGTDDCIWSRPQARSSARGLHRTSAVGIFRMGGNSLPGFTNDPCRCCSPRSITLVRAFDPQTRQLVRWMSCMACPDKLKRLVDNGFSEVAHFDRRAILQIVERHVRDKV